MQIRNNRIEKFIKNSSLLNRILSKITFFNIKYSNYFQNNYELLNKKDYLYSYPPIVNLNTTNLCNYRCIFCEIHYFYDYAKKKSGKVFANNLDARFINKFDDLFDNTLTIDLTSAVGDALFNSNFIEFSKKLKEKKIILLATTNGALLSQKIAEDLIAMQFDNIIVSLHSGEEYNYFELQGGDFNKVIKNLEYLIELRNKKKSKLPKVSINCLIFQKNKLTIKNLIKKMAEINIDEMLINQYYAARNKISHKYSFYFNPKEGNEFLKEIYDYANDLNLKLNPEKPNFIEIEQMEGNHNNSYICQAPWNVFKFKGCVEYENSHYASVCNRINLFRLNHEEFEGNFLDDIWNHEIIRYFRRSVMRNPICKFCQNPKTERLRSIDNKLYHITRDEAIKNFFIEAFNNVNIKKRKGIYLLKEFPYKYVDYYDR